MVPEAEPSCCAPGNKELGVCVEGRAPSCPDLGWGCGPVCPLLRRLHARPAGTQCVREGRPRAGRACRERGSQAAVGGALRDTCAQARPRPFRPQSSYRPAPVCAVLRSAGQPGLAGPRGSPGREGGSPSRGPSSSDGGPRQWVGELGGGRAPSPPARAKAGDTPGVGAVLGLGGGACGPC